MLSETIRASVLVRTSREARARIERALATSGRGRVREKMVILSRPLTWAMTMRTTSARVVTFIPPPVEVGAAPMNIRITCTKRV